MARARDLRISISADAKSLDRASKRAEGSVMRLQRVSTSASGKMTAAFKGAGAAVAGAFAVDKLIGFGKVAVDTASDVSESLSKNRVLFKQYAVDVDRFTKTSATSFGISRQAALEATGTFGNLFNAVGVGPRKAAQLSVSLTKLAADMASFNNASPEEALEAIRSGLVGEAEPLRRFGVNIQDAALREQAMAMGLTKTTKNVLTPYQKALAAQALIVKQTSAAHGDFKRTSSGLANQQRILKAEVSDLSAEAGKVLLPALTSVARKTTDFIKGMREGTGAGGRFAAKAREIADDVKPIAKFFANHPKLIAGAVAAWATYRVAALAVTAATRLKLIGMFTGLGPRAAAGGAVAGRSFGGAAATSAGTTFGRRAPGMFGGGRFSGAMRGAGTALGALVGAAMMGELIKSVERDRGPLLNTLRGLLPLSPQPGQPKITPYKPPKNAPPYQRDKGPLRTNKPVTPSAGSQKAPDNRPRAKTSMAHASRAGNKRTMARASSIVPVPGFPGERADTSVLAEIAEIHQRYGLTLTDAYGKGHSSPGHTVYGTAADFAGSDAAMDGAVRELVAAGYKVLYDGRFGSIAWPGHGPSYVAGANAHLHVELGGGGSLHGVSRTGGATAAVGGRRGPARRKPTVLSAQLGGTLSRRPGNMGRKAGPRVPGVERGGFTANPTQGQIELLSSNNPVMRQFQIASRINEIDRLLKSGRVRGADADALIEERRGLVGDLGDMLAPADGPTPMDFAQAALAEAQLTPGLDDDLAAARDIEGKAFLDLEAARASGDPRRIAEAAGALGAARGAVSDIETQMKATTDNTDAVKAQTEALKALKDAIDEQNKFAASVAATSLGAAQRALADMISGQLGSRVGQRNASPGFAGVRARY